MVLEGSANTPGIPSIDSDVVKKINEGSVELDDVLTALDYIETDTPKEKTELEVIDENEEDFNIPEQSPIVVKSLDSDDSFELADDVKPLPPPKR